MSQKYQPDDAEELAALRRQVRESERLLKVLKQQVVSLERERKKLSAIVNHSDAGFLLFDLADRVAWSNATAARILGCGDHAGVMFGRSLHEVICGQSHEAGGCPERNAILTGAVTHRELQLSTDDRTRIVYLTALPLLSPTGVLEETLLMLQDITDLETLRRSQRLLEEARNRAEAATEAKSEFLANMSHEIRTPLHAVIGMADLLSGTELSAEQREFTRTIGSSADALLQVINQILDFSKGEAGKLVLDAIPLDVREVFEDAVDLVAERAHSKGLDVTLLIEPDVPAYVIGDPGRLRQVVLNLVGNATKFTERGDVSIAVRRLGGEGRSVHLHVAVKDTGIGIAPEHQVRLFQPFVQGDGSSSRRFGGTGLGLSISRALIEVMGGELEVASEAGEGSTFSFTLQLECPPSGVPSSGVSFDGGGRRVLVVTSHDPTAQQLTQLLHGMALRVEHLTGSENVVNTVRNADATGGRFALAVIDHRFPTLDGFALAAALRRAMPELPVALASSFTQRGDRRKARAAGCEEHISRPVRRTPFQETIVRMLRLSDPRDGARAQQSSLQAAHGRALRILVVDDNEVNQRVITRMLRKLGHRVDAAADGEEGVAAVARYRYDAVLMDCQMPVLDGYGATRRIRALATPSSQVPIIAFTASTQLEERERCVGAGMNDFLSKPARLKDLAAALERCCPRPSTTENKHER